MIKIATTSNATKVEAIVFSKLAGKHEDYKKAIFVWFSKTNIQALHEAFPHEQNQSLSKFRETSRLANYNLWIGQSGVNLAKMCLFLEVIKG